MIRLTKKDGVEQYEYHRSGEIPTGYTDVNTITNILAYHHTTGEDSIVQTNALRGALIDLAPDDNEATGYGLLTDDEKKRLLAFRLGSKQQRLDVLSGVIDDLVDVTSASIQKARHDRVCRFDNATVALELYTRTYLGSAAAEVLFEANGYIEKYKDTGLMGTLGGDPVEGLADYVNSTAGTSFENSGMRQKTWPISDSLTIDDLCDLLLYKYLIRGH